MTTLCSLPDLILGKFGGQSVGMKSGVSTLPCQQIDSAACPMAADENLGEGLPDSINRFFYF